MCPSVTRPLPRSQSSQGRLRGASGGGIDMTAGGRFLGRLETALGRVRTGGSLVVITCVLMYNPPLRVKTSTLTVATPQKRLVLARSPHAARTH